MPVYLTVIICAALFIPAAALLMLIINLISSFIFTRINEKHNSRMAVPTGFVEDQSPRRGSVRDLRYGLFSLGYNGCEIIAIHNAILAKTGESVPIPKIAKVVQSVGGMALFGALGSDPFFMGAALKKLKVPYRRVKRARDMTEDGVYVVSFFLRPPVSSVHTVAVVKKGENFRAYNNTGAFSPENCKGFITGYYLK